MFIVFCCLYLVALFLGNVILGSHCHLIAVVTVREVVIVCRVTAGVFPPI